MNTRIAEEHIFNKKTYPLIYLVKKQPKSGDEKIIKSHSGIFYIMITIVIFFSIGVLLNVGLKIQSVNYERKIIEINELIAIENERSDRLQLKISELRSPARIIGAAEAELGMEISDNLRIIKVQESDISSQLKVKEYIESTARREVEIYDSFLGTIYNIKDIVMVVSEGVLTFFIP